MPPEASSNSWPLDAAQRAGVHAADADAGLLVADHVRTELEQRAAAGDVKVIVPVLPSSTVSGQVERRGVDRERVAVAVGRNAVDGGDDVGAFVAGAAQARFERAAATFADHFHVDEGVRTVVGRIGASRVSPLAVASTPVASDTRLTAAST